VKIRDNESRIPDSGDNNSLVRVWEGVITVESRESCDSNPIKGSLRNKFAILGERVKGKEERGICKKLFYIIYGIRIYGICKRVESGKEGGYAGEYCCFPGIPMRISYDIWLLV